MTVDASQTGIPLVGDSLLTLFRQAARELGGHILPPGKFTPETYRTVYIQSRDRAELFQDFLDELQYIWETEHFGWQGVDMEIHSDKELTARIHGAILKVPKESLDATPSRQYNIGVIERDSKGMWRSFLTIAAPSGNK